MTLIPPDLREAVVDRARGRCEYCRLAQESQVATFPVDHIIPTVLLGPTALGNLALACTRCNAKKWVHIEAADPMTEKRYHCSIRVLKRGETTFPGTISILRLSSRSPLAAGQRWLSLT